MKPETKLALNATFVAIGGGAIVGTVLDTVLVMVRYSPPAGAEPPNFFLATLATFIGSFLFYGLGGLILFPLQTFVLFLVYVKKFRCWGGNYACLVRAGLVIAAAAFAPVAVLLWAMFPQNVGPSIIPLVTGVAAGLWYTGRPAPSAG